MLDGKRFFPLTGMPMSNIDCNRIRFADWEPVPFAVAILIVKSLAMVSIELYLLGSQAPAPKISDSQALFEYVA